MARLITEVMSPIVLIVVVTLVVAVDTAGAIRGTALGLVSIFFAGGLARWTPSSCYPDVR